MEFDLFLIMIAKRQTIDKERETENMDGSGEEVLGRLYEQKSTKVLFMLKRIETRVNKVVVK